jgi:hypothetical protein
MRRNLICYAEGHEGAWAAYCPDLDLAVQGRTFEEVYGVLRDAVYDYIDAAEQETPADRDRLLSRKAPLLERLRLYWRYLAAVSRTHDAELKHGFTLPCPA